MIKNNIFEYENLKFRFPAVRLSIAGKIMEPDGAGKKINELEYEYCVRNITFRVQMKPLRNNIWHKKVVIESSADMPTPDWVELDRQTVPFPDLALRGYRATDKVQSSGAVEEGAGVGEMPGCGYPLIGSHFFVSAEHPAAFAVIESKNKNSVTYSLRQHPVWNKENRIVLADTVFCQCNNAEETFRKYLDKVRIPVQKKTRFSLCTFWSDPYAGNMDYITDPVNYRKFIDAYSRLGVTPDFFTLDAGWQNQKSIFEPKAAFGGFAGIQKLERHIRRQGARMGLWTSYNGPVGIDPEFLKSQGIAVGQGNGSLYGGPQDFGVLLYEKLEKAIGDRLVQYAKMGIAQFKVDWDNECATNTDFDTVYPTQNHVREGAINAMIRILKRIRRAAPEIVIRSGWWPSPWWLQYVNHVFLSDSNDSEYTTLPSRTQRDSASTYRDTMYYCHFVRDKNSIPLESIDNHEFVHALRNPFHETPGTAADTLMLAVMRGTSYLPLTLQPEALEDWFAKLLRKTMAFARTYGGKWYSSRSSMFGGNPNEGQIYGFRYELKDGTAWCVLRNPSAMPQNYEWKEENRSGVWIYPYFDKYTAGTTISFVPHEVKVILLSQKKMNLPFDVPFQAERADDGEVEFRFPAHLTVGKIRPMVEPLYQINAIQYEIGKKCVLEDGLELLFKLRLPYRMRNTTINIEVTSNHPEQITLQARASRSASDCGSCVQLPVTHYEAGLPGIGEAKNPDIIGKCSKALFSIPAAEGGEDWYSLFIHGTKDWNNIRVTASGYYAPSLDSVRRIWHPAWLPEFPSMHPDGFPVFIEIQPNKTEQSFK